jgi:putative SOS response-associated peptidase YedK
MPTSKEVIFQNATKRADKLPAKGKEVDFENLLRMEPDGGTTNVRNTSSSHWKRWLGVESWCLVPFNSFSEFNRDAGGDIWFAFGEERPTAFFAGIWARQWTSVRKVNTGEETIDLYAFLTTEPNAEVGAIHPKAMPVILTTPEECETWMATPGRRFGRRKRRFSDGTLGADWPRQCRGVGEALPWGAPGDASAPDRITKSLRIPRQPIPAYIIPFQEVLSL